MSHMHARRLVRKLAVKADKVIDTVTLDHVARGRQEAHVRSAGGLSFHLVLERPLQARDGDAYQLDDGRLVRISAAAEPLLAIRAESPTRLARLALQIGASHTLAEVADEVIYVADDPAIYELVRGLGGAGKRVQRAFEPEAFVELCSGHGPGHHHGHHHHAHSGGAGHRDHLLLGEAEPHGHHHHHAHGEGCDCGDDHHDHEHHDHHGPHDHDHAGHPGHDRKR